MFSWSFSQRRRASVFFCLPLLVLVGILIIYHWIPSSQLNDYLYLPKYWRPVLGNVPNVQPPETLGFYALPEYNPQPSDTPWCHERYSHKYLEKIQETPTGLCTSNSQTNLTCFHASITSDFRIDMLCIGKSAGFHPTDRKFTLGCEKRDLNLEEKQRGTPDISKLSSYWYDTGPRFVFDTSVKLENNIKPLATTSNYTILLKREGANNLWHCLNEIWSMMMSLDVLRMTRDPSTDEPFFTADDIDNTQIMILDEHEDGPYFDLWTVFAKKPIIRIKDLPDSTEIENVILPLAGASNPLWLGDWDVHGCGKSELLYAFTHRVLDFYGLDTQTAEPEGKLILTYIERKDSRVLIDSDSYFDELQATIPHLKTQAIDFAAITFAEQLKIVRETDILVGVHGAGLTHGMFLREGSVMVEILPQNLTYKGFRNLAGLAGNIYISAHGVPLPMRGSAEFEGANIKDLAKRDWHAENVYLEKERFMNVMKVAIKSLFNKGNKNYDVV